MRRGDLSALPRRRLLTAMLLAWGAPSWAASAAQAGSQSAQAQILEGAFSPLGEKRTRAQKAAVAERRAWQSLNWDVIVVGAGGAGFAAAVSAMESGAKSVLMLEKTAMAGGHAIASSGSLNAVDPVRQAAAGRTDSVDAFVRDTYEGGGRRADLALVRAMAEGSPSMIEWLEGMGVPFSDDLFEAYNGMFARAHRTRLARSGLVYVEKLAARAYALGVKRVFLCRVHAVKPAAGGWSVLSLGPEGEAEVWRARAVVVATGGFGATAAQRVPPQKAGLFSAFKGTTYSQAFAGEDPAEGDGLDIVQAAGGTLVDMDAVMAIPFWGGRVLDYPGAEIFLTNEGERFCDETSSWNDVLAGLEKSESPAFWVVTDAASDKGATFAAKVQAGTVHSAVTLSALASLMRVPEAVLKAALERYNAAARSGVDPDFGRTRFTQEIKTPPFYVGRERFEVHYTCGGVAITPKAEVRAASGGVIDGLFAAGEVTGGVHGGFRLGGSGLTDAFVFGRIAGRSAAEAARRVKAAAADMADAASGR